MLSKRFDAKEFAKASRDRWGIGNSPHWLLDVAFREDECRVHAGYAAENFTVPRHIALNLLKQGTRIKQGIKTRRKVTGWDENYLLELLRACRQIANRRVRRGKNGGSVVFWPAVLDKKTIARAVFDEVWRGEAHFVDRL